MKRERVELRVETQDLRLWLWTCSPHGPVCWLRSAKQWFKIAFDNSVAFMKVMYLIKMWVPVMSVWFRNHPGYGYLQRLKRGNGTLVVCWIYCFSCFPKKKWLTVPQLKGYKYEKMSFLIPVQNGQTLSALWNWKSPHSNTFWRWMAASPFSRPPFCLKWVKPDVKANWLCQKR